MNRPPTNRVSRGRVVRRRGLALLLLAACVALGLWLAAGALRGSDDEPDAAPTTTPTPTARPLRIIFPEGFTRRQMAERVDAVRQIARENRGVRARINSDAYLAATRSSPIPGRYARDGKARSLEGFLFPATYQFTRLTTSKQLVDLQLKAFRRNWAKIDMAYARSKNLTPYDVLIIASMIEEEVIAPEERALVAAVIYNRLKLGMQLGIDATIRYGLNVPPTESLRVSQLEHPTPYNTREHVGLPPGPITNPGLASMQAAAHPAEVDHLYFVRKPDKVHHFFTRSKQEFDDYQARHGY